MISSIFRLFKRPLCDHPNPKSEDYDVLLSTSHWDSQGEYRPYFEGTKYTCEECGKEWREDISEYRYYVSSDRELIEKVQENIS